MRLSCYDVQSFHVRFGCAFLPMPLKQSLCGLHVCPVGYDDALGLIMSWAAQVRSCPAHCCTARSVCCANVHMVMEAHDDPALQAAINAADLVVPDGMPLVWLLGALGHPLEDRVYGPTLTARLLEAAEKAEVSVGFYGAAPETLACLLDAVRSRHPALPVVYAESPPFRQLTPAEDDETVRRINASGAQLLFVGLGCPKQEWWIARHRDRLAPVLLGVGAAFDFLAGTQKQAPSWMQDRGLEWLFRLLAEPRRLWRRYLLHNPRFVILALLQVLQARWSRFR